MKFLNTISALSFLSVFAAAANTLIFPPNENFNDFSGKNGVYLVHYEVNKRFPFVFQAHDCRLDVEEAYVTCRIEDDQHANVISRKYGGQAKLTVNDMTISNPKNCNTEKNLSEVHLFNDADISYQVLGTLDGDVYAKKFGFVNTDGCEYYGEVNKFIVEKY